jgi:hypothetical protein
VLGVQHGRQGREASERSIPLRSSRTLPGHPCAESAASASGASTGGSLPAGVSIRKRWRASAMASSGRSRSGGTRKATTCKRQKRSARNCRSRTLPSLVHLRRPAWRRRRYRERHLCRLQGWAQSMRRRCRRCPLCRRRLQLRFHPTRTRHRARRRHRRETPFSLRHSRFRRMRRRRRKSTPPMGPSESSCAEYRASEPIRPRKTAKVRIRRASDHASPRRGSARNAKTAKAVLLCGTEELVSKLKWRNRRFVEAPR